ncbi:DUF1599 domain-containing protein [Microbacterium xanthum]|uniref:DUF1599 domain-containing protein n=1 Tax=Microbacterium xanthum TaxID=3079794 RepID=UPI002AD1F63E|nr:DUF1599 domain-containing protein [Microbacterium sp. KSW-48]MDZ8172426.1 DUF1599 domain-containing protein [Microbacterium sp. KSW-48]
MHEVAGDGQDSKKHETELGKAVGACRDEFSEKFTAYGHSWAILRVSSLADRVWTKAARIRRLEELASRSVSPRVPEGAVAEYRGVVNYSVMLLDRLDHEGLSVPDLNAPSVERWSSLATAMSTYDSITSATRELLERKDHDYDGAWRSMRTTTITDEILVRISRVNSILSSPAPDIEVLRDQFQDILNYSLFAIALLSLEAQR